MGIAVLIVSSDFIFVSVPLFLSCFGLAIVALARRYVITGIIMLILAFTIPPACVFRAMANEMWKPHSN
jgi:hypothetical protein